MGKSCIHDECEKQKALTGKSTRAHYNYDGLAARYCKKHADLISGGKMISIGKKVCKEGDCTTAPSYNYLGSNPEYCQKHAILDGETRMYNLVNKCKNEMCTKTGKCKIAGLPGKYCEEHAKQSSSNVKISKKGGKTCYICNKDGAYFHLPNDLEYWYCANCRDPESMINHKSKYCKGEACKQKSLPTIATYNYRGIKKPEYCAKCALEDMIPVNFTHCKSEGCDKFPCYNLPGNKKGLTCKTHIEDGFVDVIHKKCKGKNEDGTLCDLQPSFNFKGKLTPTFCSKHKTDDMINIHGKKCMGEGCYISPSFNFKGETVAIYCVEHKKDGMVCLRETCQYASCTKRPSFGKEEDGIPLYCSVHAEGMDLVNVKAKKCLELGCPIIPSYNHKGSPARYCIAHKKKNMIDVTCRRCQEDECAERATHNFSEKDNPLFCKDHAKLYMINICYKRCEGDPYCLYAAIYNKPGMKAKYCSHHIRDKPGMVIFPRTRCVEGDCKEFATHGIRWNRPDFCKEHAPYGCKCAIHEQCKNCNLVDIIDEEGYCVLCHPNSIKDNRLFQQREVVNWLKCSKHDDFKTVDKIPIELKECGDSYRPDIVYDCGDHYVVIEVDEKQHKDTKYRMCDIPRMINIQQSFALPTIFIRYNPDKFKRARRIINITAHKRKGTLIKAIEKAKLYSENDQLKVLYLYYDEYQETKENYETINIMEEIKKINNNITI